MPSYKVIPFYPSLLDFIHNNDSNLILNVGANLIEMLPSWMSILKRIEPNNSMPVIVVDSQITELDIFNKELKEKLKDINYKINDNQEWISFIISPIKILSTNNNSLWLNEMTSWLSYSLIGNKIHNDFEYAFEAPEGFLRQTSRRARSWDYFHFVNPAKDVALQLFGCYDVTPTIKAINESHFQNVKGQYIVWKCSPLEIQEISYIVHDVDLSVKLLEDLNEEESIITISTRMFDPFMGLYCLSPDWNSFENGSVREILNRNHLLSKLPGAEYTGTIPDFFEEAINNYKRNYKQVIVTELEYIVGFPIKHNERRIQVSRFQMINERYASDIKSHMNSLKPIELKDSELILSCIDNTWGEDAIYELSFSWTPDIFLTSKEDYIKNEKKILSLLNNLLPTRVNNNHILKNTYEIIHSAGEIGFDYQE
ncbi:hypothetical protein CLV62_1566 [Dysgonomonas alginatilytica]|uniref:Uncharacterized protein n=1 Tax=Dysgonomonas alginatilytica TaxID=1605892 RepID=A0A2V3PJ48_9BACT|nr:hypothetical protein [Dysgonomonas alginatilytica]PXV57136.1 hypothetical protein CLV62_1566 [Dysgonomonas alginatilytica]